MPWNGKNKGKLFSAFFRDNYLIDLYGKMRSKAPTECLKVNFFFHSQKDTSIFHYINA